MAKQITQKIKLLSSAGTGFFYVTKKNPRTSTEKLVFKRYDPVVRKHVEFKETEDQVARYSRRLIAQAGCSPRALKDAAEAAARKGSTKVRNLSAAG